MSRSAILTGLGALYALFFIWYTALGGPLTEEEIEHYMSLAEQGSRDAQGLAILRNFLESDTGDDFVMVNVIELNPTPEPVPGVSAGESSADVLGKYMAYMWPALLKRACHPVIMGTAAAPAMDIWGISGAEHWSQAAFMRYRSRRDLMEIATNPDFQGPHRFKIAAMAKTVAFPADPWMSAGDPRLLLALILIILGLLLTRSRNLSG